MRIEYIFIESYRSIERQGFNLSNEFQINFDCQRSSIEISKAPFYIENFYAQGIDSMTGVIGENGVGKSNLLNYIKEVLAFPKQTFETGKGFLLVFFDTDAKKFLIVDNRSKKADIRVKQEKGIAVEMARLADLKPPGVEESDFNDTFTVLESIPSYDKLGIVYMSPMFETNRNERTYAPQRSPIVFNLSTNFLLKQQLKSTVSSYSTTENNRVISFVVNAKQIEPEIKLPDSISIIFNFVKINEFIAQEFHVNRRVSDFFVTAKARKVIFSMKELEYRVIESANKIDRIKFWLYINYLMEIIPYIKASVFERYFLQLKAGSIEELWRTITDGITKDLLQEKNEGVKIVLPTGYWTDYLSNYKKFIAAVLEVIDIGKNEKQESYHIFKVDLNKTNAEKLKTLFGLQDDVIVSREIINFAWRQMSAGESMMLTFFARLYELAQAIEQDVRSTIDKIWFLFDECESCFHPQWQKQYINLLISFVEEHFRKVRCQVIFTSHSPLVISDIPKSHLVFLKKDDSGNTVVQDSLNDHKQTFAANVHLLLTDSFFIRDGLIGEFANRKINEVIDVLVDGSMGDIEERQTEIESVINMIGEPVIKAKLLSMLENRMRANLLSIKRDIKHLRQRLDQR